MIFKYFQIIDMTIHSFYRIILCIFSSIVISGCTFYQLYSPPTTTNITLEEITPSSIEKQLQHSQENLSNSLIKPMRVSLLDGIAPDEAAVLAILYNPTLRTMRNACDIADAQLLEGWTLPNPEVSGGMEFPIGSEGDDKKTGYSVDVEWEVTSVIPLWSKIKSARAHSQAVALSIMWQEIQIAQEAKQTVYMIASRNQQLELAQEIEESLHQGRNKMHKAVEGGAKTSGDLTVAEFAWLDAQATRITVEAELKTAWLDLNAMLGMPTNKIVFLQPDIQFPQPCTTIVAHAALLLQDIENRRFDLQAMKMECESTDNQFRASLWQQIPETSVGFLHARDLEGVSSLGGIVQMEIPIFDRNQGNVFAKRALRQEMLDNYRAKIIEARAEVMRIVAHIQATQRKINAISRLMPTLKQLVGTYREASTQGSIGFFTYYEAQRQLADRKHELIGLHQTLTELVIELDTATGRPVISIKNTEL